MQDTKLFETILGLTPPWHIARVELKTDEKRVDLWPEHETTRWPCPECEALLATRPSITPTSGPGDIWTPVSFRPICMRRFRVCSV